MSTRRPTIAHRLQYAAWWFLTRFLARTPRRAAVILCDVAGWFCFHVLRIRRREVMANLEIAFGGRRPPAEIRLIGRRSYQYAILTLLEFLQPHLLRTVDRRYFEPAEGVENFPALNGRNAIALLAHLGNWEALSAYAVLMDIRHLAFAKMLHNPLINDEVLKVRKEWGIEVYPVTSMMKRAVDAARTGAWLVIVGDQDARRHGIFVNFFGRPASTFEGAGLFSWKLGMPILPAFCVRMPGPLRKLRLIVHPPIWPNQDAPREEEVRRLTEAHVRILEGMIEKYPENYFWFHRRWKTKPRHGRSASAAAPQEKPVTEGETA